MDKKTITILGGVIGVFILFIIILFLIAGCSKNTYDYESLKEKMISIADKYFKDDNKKPKNDGDEVKYSLDQMIKDGKLDPQTELFDNETDKCEGYVSVTNNNGNYLYATELKCKINGKEYKNNYLNNKIIEDNLVETGIGLYKTTSDKGDKYTFRGETTNNYLKWNDRKYRIIGINEDGSIRAIQYNAEENNVWDDRLNTDVDEYYGYNEFITTNNNPSRIKTTLKNLYNTLTSEEKSYIKTGEICVGARNVDDTINNGSIECEKTIKGEPYGLIAAYEYFQASLNDDCVKAEDDICRNYNWIASDIQTWTSTPLDRSNYEAFKINRKITASKCNSYVSIKPVINITEKADYVSGTGTKKDPYMFVEIVEED